MIYRTILFTTILLLSTAQCSAETNEVDKLLEKASHASSPTEKKELIEKLKIELANKNKAVQEKADAISKAKKKVPSKIYIENSQE